MTTYLARLTEAMTLLAGHSRSVFLGQSIVAGGTAMTQTFVNVPQSKLIEMPVVENSQMGMCTGLALGGDLPVCIFPRINFLLCAIDALVLHLDAIPVYSGFRPKVIIRTSIASPIPLDPGPQHIDPLSDNPQLATALGRTLAGVPYLEPAGYVAALRAMLRTVYVHEIRFADDVLPAYRAALARPLSTIIVERADLYDSE